MQRAVERGNGIEGNREGKWNRGKNREGRRKMEQREKENVEEIDLKEMKRNIKEMR